MQKINIDKKYFEERLKLIKAAENDVYTNIRSVDTQESTLKQARSSFNSELLRLNGEKRFVKALLEQLEINDKSEPEPEPEAKN